MDVGNPWVDANPKESDFTYVAVGQSVTLEVDAFPNHVFKGTVGSLSPGTGAQFAILPPQNANGNWVKVVQRVPVRIVFDPDQDFAKRCNPAMVDLEPVLTEAEQQAKLPRDLWHLGQSDEATLRGLVENHAKYTGSRRAQQILGDWAASRTRFVKIFPKEYRRALGELAAAHKKVAA